MNDEVKRVVFCVGKIACKICYQENFVRSVYCNQPDGPGVDEQESGAKTR